MKNDSFHVVSNKLVVRPFLGVLLDNYQLLIYFNNLLIPTDLSSFRLSIKLRLRCVVTESFYFAYYEYY